MNERLFNELIWQKGAELYRDMPWRDTPSFYNVLVSELMLQQTQVPRVITKFAEFMLAFPSVENLAAASLADVLRVWQGLGYNRRAKYLHECAKAILVHGQPSSLQGLTALPGIGKNTAAAIMNYVYQIPTPFVETNIRTVYFRHFYPEGHSIRDDLILDTVACTIDREHPREWFWAIMDYGSWLKMQGHGRLDTSSHYKKQPKLEGSVRQVRGQIIKELTGSHTTLTKLKTIIKADERFERAYQGLLKDGLIVQNGTRVYLTK